VRVRVRAGVGVGRIRRKERGGRRNIEDERWKEGIVMV
jgi:hypothetical protein